MSDYLNYGQYAVPGLGRESKRLKAQHASSIPAEESSAGRRLRSSDNIQATVQVRAVDWQTVPGDLRSYNSFQIYRAVNSILAATFEPSPMSGSELVFEINSEVFDAMLDLLERLLPHYRCIEKSATTSAIASEGYRRAVLDNAWESSGWKETVEASRKCVEGDLVLCLLAAIRNATFVFKNDRTIAHSTRCVRILLTALCELRFSEQSATALDVFTNITDHIDLTGQRTTGNEEKEGDESTWLEQSLWYLAPQQVRSGSDDNGLVDSLPVLEYVATVSMLFPLLARFIMGEEKQAAIKSLDVLLKLGQVPSNRDLLVKMPDSLLSRLVDLLNIPLEGPDALLLKDNSSSMRRGSQAVIANTSVDTEIREMALEVIGRLAQLSDSLKARLGAVRGCIADIVQLLKGPRQDHGRSVALTLKRLASVPENRRPFLALQQELMEMACRNRFVADLYWNGMSELLFETSE